MPRPLISVLRNGLPENSTVVPSGRMVRAFKLPKELWKGTSISMSALLIALIIQYLDSLVKKLCLLSIINVISEI